MYVANDGTLVMVEKDIVVRPGGELVFDFDRLHVRCRVAAWYAARAGFRVTFRMDGTKLEHDYRREEIVGQFPEPVPAMPPEAVLRFEVLASSASSPWVSDNCWSLVAVRDTREEALQWIAGRFRASEVRSFRVVEVYRRKRGD